MQRVTPFFSLITLFDAAANRVPIAAIAFLPGSGLCFGVSIVLGLAAEYKIGPSYDSVKEIGPCTVSLGSVLASTLVGRIFHWAKKSD